MPHHTDAASSKIPAAESIAMAEEAADAAWLVLQHAIGDPRSCGAGWSHRVRHD